MARDLHEICVFFLMRLAYFLIWVMQGTEASNRFRDTIIEKNWDYSGDIPTGVRVRIDATKNYAEGPE